MPEDIEPAPDTAALGRWLDAERRAGRGRATGAGTAHRRIAEHAVPRSSRRRADGAADARIGRGRRPARRPAAGDPAGARTQGHRRAARRADRGRRIGRNARQAVLRDGRDRRVEPDGRRLAGAVRHRPRRPSRPGVRARRGRGQTRRRRLAGPGSGGVRPPGRLPRASGGPLAELPADLPGAGTSRPRRGRRLAAPQPARRTTRPASCTATTSSPTSCTRTALRPGWPRSWTGR